LKNYIERLHAAADADGAMAFFYPLLNSWVLTAFEPGASALIGTCADTCQNNLSHVEFPLTFPLTFLQYGSRLGCPNLAVE